MGIQGLLPFLEKSTRKVSLSEYSGCTVAVDAYCWLHKGAFSCAEKLARGEETDLFVLYCMKYINMLLSYNIKPILVFDGQHLPAKADTEKVRRERREMNRRKAAELLRADKGAEARNLIRRSVDVTHAMALALIKRCRAIGVDAIVAPYEADAQLAYLNIEGIAQLVITEDSDLLLFGCTKVVFKMDINGNGLLIEQERLPLSLKQRPDQFSLDKFRRMCILSGCDYLPSLPGIGLVKAAKFITRSHDENISRALTRLGAHLNMSHLVVTEEYREKFLEAERMFRHQPVFDPRRRRVVALTPVPEDSAPLGLPSLDPQVAYQLALGNLDPFSLLRVDTWDPDTHNGGGGVKAKSIWCKEFGRDPPPKLPEASDPRKVERPSTRGKMMVQSVSPIAPYRPRDNPALSFVKNTKSTEEELEELKWMYMSPPLKKVRLEEEAEESEGGESKRSPRKEEEDFSTFDDLIEGSPVSEGKSWLNPFSLSARAKIKRTSVDENCIVQSRYFGSGGCSSSPVKGGEVRSPLCETLNKIEGDARSERIGDGSEGAKKHVVSATKTSFLSRLDSLSGSTFKWSSQSITQVMTQMTEAPETNGILTPPSLQERKVSPPTPVYSSQVKGPIKVLEKVISGARRQGLSKKRKTSASTTPLKKKSPPKLASNQPSLLSMFAFQPKAKLH